MRGQEAADLVRPLLKFTNRGSFRSAAVFRDWHNSRSAHADMVKKTANLCIAAVIFVAAIVWMTGIGTNL